MCLAHIQYITKSAPSPRWGMEAGASHIGAAFFSRNWGFNQGGISHFWQKMWRLNLKSRGISPFSMAMIQSTLLNQQRNGSIKTWSRSRSKSNCKVTWRELCTSVFVQFDRVEILLQSRFAKYCKVNMCQTDRLLPEKLLTLSISLWECAARLLYSF